MKKETNIQKSIYNDFTRFGDWSKEINAKM